MHPRADASSDQASRRGTHAVFVIIFLVHPAAFRRGTSRTGRRESNANVARSIGRNSLADYRWLEALYAITIMIRRRESFLLLHDGTSLAWFAYFAGLIRNAGQDGLAKVACKG